ncbi:MAG: GatB/YqeY domain-containing protein [Anaerolineae bacterium]|nr:GatB/YqeY domain-containing protein [Anaerolineae bacterium]
MAETLQDRLAADLKTALREGDETRKITLRGVLAAFKKQADTKRRDALLAEARRRGVDLTKEAVTVDEAEVALTEQDLLAVIQREVKQRRESIAEFTKGGRADLIRNEEAELAVLETYVPQPMSREEVAALARSVIQEVGATGPAQTGQVMKALMARLQGRADGRLVNEVVRDLLSGK